VRLHKLLAASGHGSRRAIEAWIRAGRVSVNGVAAQLGQQAGPADDIRLDGRCLAIAPAAQAAGTARAAEVLLYHKPVGEVTTRRDPQGRPTVFARLPPPEQGRWIVVGRLDVNTSGLLLFTTDGELAHRLMHPSAQVEREYLVRVRGTPRAAQLQALERGIELEDGPARFDRLVAVRAGGTERSHSWYRVVLHEGRKREVRRLWAAVGVEVSRLVRTRFGPLSLPEALRAGAWRRARPAEGEHLRVTAGLPARA
jgi:23S rRNA pseudouridine2605 synthase